ncbi:hypothetical protein KUV57_12480 [Epibacterium sp. DP7N7-1]|nr:hypothetical protein [Epibacterium sp. DP7N7-1]
MTKSLAQRYIDLANEVFKPNLVNNPEDFEELYRACKELMHQNGMMCPEDPEDPVFMTHEPVNEEHPVMEFIYRAQQICEINETGFIYHKVGSDYVLETIANTTASYFQQASAEFSHGADFEM